MSDAAAVGTGGAVMSAYIVKRSICTYHYAFNDEDRRAIAHVSTEDFEFDPVHKDHLVGLRA